MESYDPLVSPQPEEWLALDEGERIRLVEDYHRRAGIKLPNARMHAVVHAIVENQVALGDEIPVRRTLERLMNKAADRHTALHAIGEVLAMHLFEIARRDPGVPDPNAGYYAALEKLTIKSGKRR